MRNCTFYYRTFLRCFSFYSSLCISACARINVYLAKTYMTTVRQAELDIVGFTAERAADRDADIVAMNIAGGRL